MSCVVIFISHKIIFFTTKYHGVLLEFFGDIVYNNKRLEIPSNNRIVNRRIAKMTSREN